MLNTLVDQTVLTPIDIRPRVFMICVAIRCLLAILTYMDKVSVWFLLAFSMIISVAFLKKSLGHDTWKPYPKTAFIYSGIFTLSAISAMTGRKTNDMSGALIFMDAMIGLSAKDMFDKLMRYSQGP
jgi:hypothetical protein